MEKFKFRLQNVLDYRQEIKEKKKEEYQKEFKNVLNQREILKNLTTEKDNALNNKRNYKTKVDYQLLYLYVDSLNIKIQKQKIVIINAEKILEQKQTELLQSTKECKIMEKLKENSFNEFRYESNKKEQQQNDDFAIHNYIKNERG